MQSRAILAGGLVPLIALMATGCLDRSQRSDGPLKDGSGNITGVGGPVKRDQFFALGLFVPKNESGREAVLESLRPDDPGSAEGLEMRYAAVGLQARTCRVGATRGWPPLGCWGKLHAIEGFRIPEGVGARLVVGARARQLGRWSIPAFRVRYRIGDHGYETTYQQGMKMRVVRGLGWAGSASFASFQTEAHNIGCAYASATGRLRCELGSGPCYEMQVAGTARDCARPAGVDASAHTLRARASWLYRGFRCYAGHASVRCRNQNFKGFFISARRSHRT